jgi:hypothetical protein
LLAHQRQTSIMYVSDLALPELALPVAGKNLSYSNNACNQHGGCGAPSHAEKFGSSGRRNANGFTVLVDSVGGFDHDGCRDSRCDSQ